MTIAIDISPLKSGHYLQHRVRGTGFYLKNLQKSLVKFYPNNKYIFFTRGDPISSSIDVAHYPYFEPFFLTLPLFSKYKRVVTVHDLTPLVFPEHFKSGLKGMLKWQIQKVALKNASLIIADSESSKKDIVKFVGLKDSRVKVVYLAAGEEFRKYQMSSVRQAQDKCQILKDKYKLPDKFALYVGDATWNKNLPRLIEAVKKLKISLVMAGSALTQANVDLKNPWNKDLITVRRLIEGDKRIISLGFIPTEDLVLLYNTATLFVMPSLYEGFGLPILEAMSCGCPVVTSKEGSLKEIAGDAAYFVDAYSVDSISEGIQKVASHKSLQEILSLKGLLQAKKFSWEMTAKKTIESYEKASLTID